MHLIIALALALSLGVGTSAVAQFAQEGDALYTVKTNVNDRIEAVVSPVTAEVRALFSTKAEVEAEANTEAEANAAGGTSLTELEGGINTGAQLDTDLEVSTEAESTVNLNL